MSTEIMVGTRWHAFSLIVVLTFVSNIRRRDPYLRKERSEEKDQSTKEWIAFHRVPSSYNADSKKEQPVTEDMNTVPDSSRVMAEPKLSSLWRRFQKSEGVHDDRKTT